MTGSDRDLRDSDLRNRFAALRREEESQAPEFSLPSRGRAGHGHRRSAGKLIAFAGCLLTIVAAVFLLRLAPLKPKREPGRPVPSLTQWRAPTDFLLETPGRELLRTVPTIGVWHGYTEAPRPRQKHPQLRKQVLR